MVLKSGPTVGAFPVQVYPGFTPSDLDKDGVDLGPAGKPCAGYGGDHRPKWGGGFDAPRGPQKLQHRAIDIMAAEGALVVSPCDGHVTSSGHSDKGGYHCYIRDNDGWVWYMAHCLEPMRVVAGQNVNAGTVVGLVGRTGNAVRKTKDGLRGCPHLHLSLTAPHWRKVFGPDGKQVARRGDKVDPVPFLRPLYEAGGWLRQPGPYSAT
jgi:murein DD-endopeptidase MepM/ murein hydrolase activator NlpD